jgi:DNA polymerase
VTNALDREERDAAIPKARTVAQLRALATGCRACELWARATQTVFGDGPVSARLMMVGEQPGNSEDLEGVPFVGSAGRLLDRAMVEAGIDRERV